MHYTPTEQQRHALACLFHALAQQLHTLSRAVFEARRAIDEGSQGVAIGSLPPEEWFEECVAIRRALIVVHRMTVRTKPE